MAPHAPARPCRGFAALVAAQALSALADHALLIVGMARLAELGLAAWWAPLLKLVFTLAYVLLAPMVGSWADSRPKRAALGATLLPKAIGVAWLLGGGHPLPALALAGIGAAAAAPARYGWVAQAMPAPRLVAANAWLEGTHVAAALAGIGLGGWLVRPESGGVAVACSALLALQAGAGLLLIKVPEMPASHHPGWPHAMWRDFGAAQRCLWRDADAGLSLALTTLFWGAAAVLQIAVLQWAGQVLGLPLHEATALQLAVALGIVAGAGWAGRHVPLTAARRLLPLGVLLGLGTAAASWLAHAGPALAAMALLGAIGGVLVVPMNALLQQRGQVLLGTGRAIAVQNFAENTGVLLMLALQALLLAAGLDVRALMTLLGLAVAGAVALLMIRR
ncbi:MAG: lysophospholipid transporter LplT [Betaproteobacteria bacterium]|nr:lysophospholipid transporter LplT [Rubrivivax sp.]